MTMEYLSKLCLYITVFLSTACVGSKTNHQKNEILSAENLHPYGRAFMNGQQLELIGSAVHFGFSFEGSQCKIYVSLPSAGLHNYLQYELDGIYQKRIRIEGNSKDPVVIIAPKTGKHSIWIYKCTEATTGPVYIQKVEAENLKSLTVPTAPLIEFIGNSITCGAAADASEVPCGQGEYHDHHNAYYAYGPRVARDLGVNYFLSSVSGIGIYRNWNSDGPTMPQVYEKADLREDDTRLWNFSAYTPQIVSIALGTNDFSNGDGVKKRLPFDSALFISNYVKFVQLVKSKYPKAQIALLSSPMVGGSNGHLLESCLQAVKRNTDALYKSDKPIALFFFKPMQPHGCSYHPSVEDHAEMANELFPFFKSLLGR